MDPNAMMFPQMPSGHITWPQVAMYLIMVTPVVIPLLITLIKTLKLEKGQKANTERLINNTDLTAKTACQLTEVHDKVNGKMEALIEAKVKAALAEGRITGAQEEKAKNSEAIANQLIGKTQTVPITIVPAPIVQPIAETKPPSISI